jgi:hypothetical protein
VAWPNVSPLSGSVTFGLDLVPPAPPKGKTILAREFGVCLSFPQVVAAFSLLTRSELLF